MLKDDTLADDIIVRQLSLFRFSAGERAAVLSILRQMEEELVQLLYFDGRALTDIGREDKARLLRQTQAVIEDYYSQASGRNADALGELAKMEATAYAGSIEAAFSGAITPSLPTEATLRQLAKNTLIEGAPSADWWKRQAGDVTFRFKNAVSQGIAQAETNDQIIRRIRGKYTGFTMVDGERVSQFAGGILDAPRHNAAALVQTSVQAVANAARRETMGENLDVIKGLRQVSTLDGHTTPQCIAYSQAAWNLPGYTPLAPNKLPYNGGTPRHWNCRSVEIPITRTFKELGIDLPEFDPSTTSRSATGAPVAADMSFGAFLKRQEKRGPQFVDDLLGPGRAQLWRDGKITLKQLVDQNGRPLTLRELRKLYDR
jgi:hypothetical protein